MVRIRLARSGSKKRPFYAIMVADQRRPTGGRFIERLGFYNPRARGGEEKLRLDTGRMEHWVAQGAQASERVNSLYRQAKAAPAAAPAEAPAAAPAEAPAAASAEAPAAASAEAPAAASAETPAAAPAAS